MNRENPSTTGQESIEPREWRTRTRSGSRGVRESESGPLGADARRSSPALHGAGNQVNSIRTRTEMWLEQHTEQGLLPPGFVRVPLVPAPSLPARVGAVSLAHPQGHHPRSSSLGGASYASYGQTRQSSPSQWSASQYSHSQSQSQCVTPRGGVGSYTKDGHVHHRGLPLPVAAGGHGHHGAYFTTHVGTSTPPALQITSPVTPRDRSSGYNSPRVSEDLYRHASDDFPFGSAGLGAVEMRQRRSMDGVTGLGCVSGLGGQVSGRLSPHSGGSVPRSPGIQVARGHETERSSFKSLVNYLDTRQNSMSEKSRGVRSPRSCSSFGDDVVDLKHGGEGGAEGEDEDEYGEEDGDDKDDDGDVELLVSQMEKVSCFPGSFRESLLLHAVQSETIPLKHKSQMKPGRVEETSSSKELPPSAADATKKQQRSNQQQPDVFSFPVDTLPPRTRGVLGDATKGSWPNFQSARSELDESSRGVGDDGNPSDVEDAVSDIDWTGTFPHDQRSPALQQGTLNQENEFEEITLRIIHRKNTTGFEFQRELPLCVGDEIAGRFRIVELLGQAAFSRAVQAVDLTTGQHVCLKVVKNSKDYFDQSLDEIRLLRLVNENDPSDERGIVRLFDYFYYAEHLILVTELLRANLYEFSKHDRTYFTPGRLKMVATQLLSSVAYMHGLSLIHADLKPENILMKSFAACRIKLIDLGSSFFNHDRRASYVVQSRSYRAPEVILGCGYDYKIDIWSIGCILVELATGDVLFNDSSGAQMLARMESVLGSIPTWMRGSGKFTKRYFLPDGRLFEQINDPGRSIDILQPQSSSLNYVLDSFDKDLADFISLLLTLDPNDRVSAEDALQHPYLSLGFDGRDGVENYQYTI